MRLVRLSHLALLLGVGATSVYGQIPTRRAQQPATSTGPRLLVANPHSFAPQDSEPSVLIGDALRTRMEKVSGSTFAVIPRAQMNEALVQFGYPKDAVLSQLPQRSLATSLQARVLLSGTMTRDQSGRYTVTARLAGLNDDAGIVVVVTQGAGQTYPVVGSAAADQFGPAVKAWSDARACVDQQTSAPAKAEQAAQKAIQEVPKHGLAHLCLAMIELKRGTKADTSAAQTHLQQAVAGDPLSLPAWTELAKLYEVANDTAHTVEALQQMLLVAPTNQPLREQAFKIFLKYGRPDAAEKAAEDGLRLDPTNADLWELLAGARVWRENYAGAIQAFEQVATIDSSRVDTVFYGKVLTLAAQKPDTALLFKWAGRALQRFPKNVGLMKQLVASYDQAQFTDSMVALTSRLMQVDTTAVPQALTAAQALQTAKRFKDATPMIDYAFKYGDAAAKENAAGLQLNGALQMFQPPPDYAGAAGALRHVIQVASPQGRFAPIANHFLGVSLVQQIVPLDKEAERQKSCDTAKQVEQMSAEAATAFANASGYADRAQEREQLTQFLTGLKPRTGSMIKVYCK